MAVRFDTLGENYTRTLGLASTSAWSASCWVKISVDRNDFSTAFQLKDASTFGDVVSLQTDADGTTMAFYSGGAKGARALTVGTWYYFGISVNGVNGTMVSRSAADTSFTATTWTNGGGALALETLRLGSTSFDEWMNGGLAAVKLWTGATLARDELEQEAWTYTPRRTANLKAWYPLTRAETTDYSGQGQTLTGGSGATTEDGPAIAWRAARRRVSLPLGFGAEATPNLLTGTASLPTPGVSTGLTVQPATLVGTASLPTPDIFVGSSPPTAVQPGTLVGTASFPSPTIDTVMNVNITPVPLVGRAVIPIPNVGVPINPGDDLTGPGELSYNGFKMGGTSSPYTLQTLVGWLLDMPALDNGDVPDPSAHGSMPGDKLAGPRIVTAELLINARPDLIEQVAEAFLAGLPVPDEDEQLPLAIRWKDNILVGYGACTNRAAPFLPGSGEGRIKATAQFTLARPELYSRELLSAVIPDGGFVEVTNLGNTRTKPLLRCPGPAHGPELIVERVLPSGQTDLRVLEFDLEVLLGETLIIDPALGTVTIGDVSKMRARTGASIGVPDFELGPGISELSYSTSEGGAPPATALWRHAHL